MSSTTTAVASQQRARGARLGFRVDGQTKAMVERAAGLERRSLTDFCLTALADAAQQAIARHQTLALSMHDQEIFFDALINPPRPNARLRRAFRAEGQRLAPE